ncbi:MAG: Type 1 glutamine amidotransferase-like domain-containing protein [Candidatus Kaiserbacteria bacterium]|nr:Type 1 glutamine amidotransferase-like domain-containing protein [Candidatus Kaiserbacteria bacterium]
MGWNVILLSSGFSNPAILAMVEDAVRDRSYQTGCVITTAHPKKQASPWAKATKKQLEKAGLSVSFVDFDAGDKIPDKADVLYICGGNTYHLLSSINTAPFDVRERVRDVLDHGGLYIGSSAGAVVASSNIATAGEVGGDKNDDKIDDLTGLSLTPLYVVPHDTPEQDHAIEQFCSAHSLDDGDVLRISDDEGVFIDSLQGVVDVVS